MYHSLVNPSESPVSKQVKILFNLSRLERMTTDSLVSLEEEEFEFEDDDDAASDLLPSDLEEELLETRAA